MAVKVAFLAPHKADVLEALFGGIMTVRICLGADCASIGHSPSLIGKLHST